MSGIAGNVFENHFLEILCIRFRVWAERGDGRILGPKENLRIRILKHLKYMHGSAFRNSGPPPPWQAAGDKRRAPLLMFRSNNMCLCSSTPLLRTRAGNTLV